MKQFAIALIGLLTMSCAESKVNISESEVRFEDGKFLNTHPVESHSLWQMLWDGLTSDIERAKWPKNVEAQVDDDPAQKVEGDRVRITFINHATFLIQVDGYNILTDPVFSQRTSPFSFVGPKRIHSPGISISNLPKIDLILISHDHYDHLDLSSMDALIQRDNPIVYTGIGVADRLSDTANVFEMGWGDQVNFDEGLKLWFLDVQHFSGRTLTDRNSTLWGGFLLDSGNKKIYFGGDSGYADHYERTYKKFGAVDIALLPIGAYSPRKFFKPVHLNPYEAVQAHIDLGAKMSIGMHYGTFQLSAEPYTEPQKLLELAKANADLSANEFVTLAIGVPLDVKIQDGNVDLSASEFDSQSRF